MNSAELDVTRPVVIGGVSGTGKTTIARSLSRHVDGAFLDADDLHPRSSVEQMALGVPLSDDQRWPWLDDVAAWLTCHDRSVGACSALSRAHRERLRTGAPGLEFVMLSAPGEILLERLEARRGHFMGASMLESQLATYEPLQPSEAGRTVDVSGSVEEVLTSVIAALADLADHRSR